MSDQTKSFIKKTCINTEYGCHAILKSKLLHKPNKTGQTDIVLDGYLVPKNDFRRK